MKTPRKPLDRRNYRQDPESAVVSSVPPDGEYVYVQDLDENIWILSDGPHRHPKVLGERRMALYAGTLAVVGGEVTELTNLSGTFRCDDEPGLLEIAERLEAVGLFLLTDAVRFFPFDGSAPYIIRRGTHDADSDS